MYILHVIMKNITVSSKNEITISLYKYIALKQINYISKFHNILSRQPEKTLLKLSASINCFMMKWSQHNIILSKFWKSVNNQSFAKWQDFFYSVIWFLQDSEKKS